MAEEAYDPVKRKERYERTKQLKGRQKGGSKPAAVKPSRSHPSKDVRPAPSEIKNAQDRVGRLRGKVSKLKSALTEVEAELSKKRQEARKTERESSDGKSSEKEKQASQKYRDKHQEELSTKSKKDSKSSSGGGSSTRSSNKSVSDMSVRELTARASKIRSVLRDAKQQLLSASIQHGQLAHSAITSEPNVGEQFARYKQQKGFRQNDSDD